MVDHSLRGKYPHCRAKDCTGDVYAYGYCGGHHRRITKHGDPQEHIPLRKGKGSCSVRGCPREHSAKGYCASHYARWKRFGDAGQAEFKFWKPADQRDDHGRKQCTSCREFKPESEFPRNRSTSDGYEFRCKWCAKTLAQCKRYNISMDDLLAQYAKQNGRCAICREEAELSLDHDNACCKEPPMCGKCNRALLCQNCNFALGLIRETPQVAINLYVYMNGGYLDA